MKSSNLSITQKAIHRLFHHRSLSIGIVIPIVCIWLGAIYNGFLWDDHVLIEENSQFFQTLPLYSWFTADFWNTPSIGRFSGYYRPLVSLSFVFDFVRAGLAPESFHLTNLVLHIFVSLLLWRLLRVLSVDPISSLYATLIFGIHPIQTQAVAWISGRADVLTAMGIVLCLLFFIALLQEIKLIRVLWGALATLGYAIALFSKESAIITIPLVLTFIVHERKLSKESLREHGLAIFSLASLILSLGWLFLRSAAIPELHFLANFSLATIFAISLDLIGGILWQFNYRIDYSIDPALTNLLPNPITGLLLLIFLVVATTLYRKTLDKTLRFFAYASLLSLFPAVIAVGLLSVAGARMMYLPTVFIIPFCILLLRKKVSTKTFHTTCSIFLAVCALSSLNQVALWRSDISLFTYALAKQGSHDVAHLNLGIAKYESGDFDGAAYHLNHEMLTKGEDQRHYMLGVMNLALDCEETAEDEFKLAIEKNHHFYAAYHNLAGLFANQGRRSEALAILQKFEIKSPHSAIKIASDQYVIQQIEIYASRKPLRADWCENQSALKQFLASPEALLDRAIYFLKNRQLQFARIFARAALRVSPSAIPARLIEAQVNYRLGYRKAALQTLKEIESTDLKNREAIRRLRQSLVNS